MGLAVAGRSSTDDDHARSTGRDAGVPSTSKKGLSKKRPRPTPQVQVQKSKKRVPPTSNKEPSKKQRSWSCPTPPCPTLELPKKQVPSSPDDLCKGPSKKKRSCSTSTPTEGAEAASTSKKPKRKDNSITLFCKDVQKAMLDEERKKLDKEGTKSTTSPPPNKIPGSADGGQQGTTRRDRRPWVVDEVDKHYEIIMGGKGETRQKHPSLKGCIILKERSPQTIRRKIEELLSSAAKKFGDGKEFFFEVPSLGKETFVAQYGWAHKAGKYIRYDMSKKMRKKTIGILWILSLIVESIKTGVSVTDRHVFYSRMDVFGSERVSNNLIKAICLMLRCTKSSLLIVAEPKGSVAGCIDFVMKDKDKVKDKDKDNGDKAARDSDSIKLTNQRIEDLSQVEMIRLKAKLILIVEKKSIYHNLVQTNFHRRFKCLLVTGSGYPDVATRSLIKMIYVHVEKKSLPIYALVDPDPHGLQMLLVYMFGSKNMQYDRMGMAIPSINWIPVEPKDLRIRGVSDAYFSQATERERAMLKTILEKVPHLSKSFRLVLSRMIEKKNKASLEAFFSLGIEYLSKTFLPQKFQILHNLPGTSSILTNEELGDHSILTNEELGNAWDWWHIIPKYKAQASDDETDSGDKFVDDKFVDEDDGDINVFKDDVVDVRDDVFDDVDVDVDVDDGGARAEMDDGGASHHAEETQDKYKDILDFIERSYSKAEVVNINNIVLRIEHLHLLVSNGYMHNEVINSFISAYINDTRSKSFLSTYDVEMLRNDPSERRKQKWPQDIERKCRRKHLVFIPLNINENHWVLLVVNFSKGEIQILNSIPQMRDEQKEETVLENLEKCIGQDFKGWERKPYLHIPKQTDGNSCGSYMLKYMMHWDGEKMTQDFTQDDIYIFKKEICSLLLQCDDNKLKVPSYRDYHIETEEAYNAKCAEKEKRSTAPV